MDHSWTLRVGVPGDAHAVAALTIRAWRHAYRGVLPDTVLDGLVVATRAERWRARLDDQGEHWRVIVAERGGVVGGFAGFGAALAHELRPVAPGLGEILAFYLEPTLFGTGLADQLAAEVEGWLAARFAASFLWVLEGNARARAFYSRRGWIFDGGRAPYARPGCRGVHLVRHRWAGPVA